MHSPLKRNVCLAAVLTVPFLCVTTLVRAEEPCSAYPTGTAEKIESVDLEKTFGAVPGPKKSLHFAYVTKTLINEFWQDVAAGIDHLAMVVAEGTELDLNRVTVVGHSAGGHLALWSGARSDKRGALRVPTRVRPVAAAGLAAVVDLARAHALSVGNSAVGELLEGSPGQQPTRYAVASPIALLPLGVKQLIVHGAADDALPIEMARNYAQAAQAAGDSVQFCELPAAGHMDYLDPGSEAHSTLCRWLGQPA